MSITSFKRAARSAFFPASGNKPGLTERVTDREDETGKQATYTGAARKYAQAAARAARIARLVR